MFFLFRGKRRAKFEKVRFSNFSKTEKFFFFENSKQKSTISLKNDAFESKKARRNRECCRNDVSCDSGEIVLAGPLSRDVAGEIAEVSLDGDSRGDEPSSDVDLIVDGNMNQSLRNVTKELNRVYKCVAPLHAFLDFVSERFDQLDEQIEERFDNIVQLCGGGGGGIAPGDARGNDGRRVANGNIAAVVHQATALINDGVANVAQRLWAVRLLSVVWF